MKKYALILLFSLNSLAINFGHYNGGIDVDHSPIWRNYRDNLRLEVLKCSAIIDGEEIELNAKNNYSHALKLINEFNPKLVEKTLEAITSEELFIRDLTQSIRNQYGIDKKTSALFIHEKKAVYINKSDEVGLLTVFLYHELSHAFDEKIDAEMVIVTQLYEKYKEIYERLLTIAKSRGLENSYELESYLTDLEKAELEHSYENYNSYDESIRFRAERYAFDKQDIYLQNLYKEVSCYEDYIEEHKQLNKLKLYTETPDTYIRSAYGL